MTKKTLQPTNDVYLQFTDEEIRELGWEAGQKLEIKQYDDGSIELRPYVKLELDMEEWPRETLEMIIKKSLDEDISVNDVINNIFKKTLENSSEKDEYYGCNSIRELLLEKDDSSSIYTDKVNSHNIDYTNLTSSSAYMYKPAEIDPNFTNNDTSILNFCE